MNIADRLTELAEATPYGVAVCTRERILHFRALDMAVWRAASWLRASGVMVGDVVGLAMDNGMLSLVAGYALARMGAVQLGFSRNEGMPLAEQLAARHRVSAILTDRAGAGPAGCRRLRADPRWLEGDRQPADPSLRAAGGDAPWLIVRTSGTTAAPKTLVQSHATFVARRKLAAGPYNFEPGDRYLAVIPLDFTLGRKMCMDALWVGASVILATEIKRIDILLAVADRRGATFTYLTPSQLDEVLSSVPGGRPRLPGLRVLRCGSMAMPEKMRRRVIDDISPNLVLSYGTSDLDCGITEADAGTQSRNPGSVGKPRAGVELEIVGDDGGILPAGETGHVRVRVPDMPAGYFDDPAATAKAFRDGWFYPGDLAMLTADGVLYLKGRSDDMMNFDGFKIFPSDIESVLLAHPAVAEAVAFPLASESHQHIPVAAVSMRQDIDLEDLRRWCAERLGSRAPHFIIKMQRLPRGASGKVLTREIARRMEAKIAASRTNNERGNG